MFLITHLSKEMNIFSPYTEEDYIWSVSDTEKALFEILHEGASIIQMTQKYRILPSVVRKVLQKVRL